MKDLGPGLLDNKVDNNVGALSEAGKPCGLDLPFVPNHFDIIEHSPTMVCYFSDTFDYLFINRAFRDWFNASYEEVLGKNIHDLHSKRFAKELSEQLTEALNGKTVNYEINIRHLKSGGTRWVDATYTPDFDENKKIRGIYAYIRDISDSKEDEGTRSLLQLALDQGMDGFFLQGRDGCFTYVNTAMARMLGYLPEELIGTHWSHTYTEEVADRIKEEIVPVVIRDGKWRGQLIALKKDGTPIDIDFSLARVTDQLDHAVGLVCSCRDITERKKTEQELLQAATVFESTAEGVVITDNEFRIIATNPVYSVLTGYQEDDVIGMTDCQLYSLAEGELTIEAIRKTLESTGKWQGEIYHKRQDGTSFPTWQTISPVVDKEGHIKSYVVVLDDISQLKRSQERLYHMAHYDYLTGLPNRILLNERLDLSLAKADSSGYQVALLFLDLDNFKHINDTLGHAFGDKLLAAVAHKIVNTCRDDDIIARVSGDEFIIIVEHVKHSTMVARLAEKLLETFNTPITIEGREFFQSASIGVSLYPGDGATAEELMKHADVAMYKAKEEGRQTFRFYHESMSALALQHINLDNQLRKALAQSQFVLHYQPVVRASTLDLVGMEALVRWQHPEWGLTYPDKFIPHAEGSNLISKIGRWVLAEACRQAKEWLDKGIEFDCIAVNASGGQLRDGFVEIVKQILDETGLPPNRLELELTETYLMTDVSRPKEILQGLSDLGICIAIDDFGVGYSSLSRLKELPIHRLKVDRSFIADIATDQNDWSIVQAIIAMSESLGLEVTAEGVETQKHYQLLSPYTNVCAQGYYFAKPAPAESIPELIKTLDKH